jgi:hypothetical protein
MTGKIFPLKIFIYRMASKERLIIIFCQYEPLNVMITDFINNPEIDKDDYYRFFMNNCRKTLIPIGE